MTILDSAFEGIDSAIINAEQNLANARNLFPCYLHAFFKESRTDAGDQLANYLERITHGFTNPMPTASLGPHLVTARDIVGGKVNFTTSRRTTQNAFDTLLTEKSRPKRGDLLLTKDGTLGRLAVVETDEPICVNQSVAVLRTKETADPHYLKYVLSSPFYQKLMVEQSGGTTVKHIYITRVDKMLVLMPDRAEQGRAVEHLDAVTAECERSIRLYKQKTNVLRSLRQTFLRKAFAGELRTGSREVSGTVAAQAAE